VNVVPRDLLGVPILRLSLLLAHLPPRIADAINGPLMRMIFGDITRLELKKKPYGVFEQIKNDRDIPVLDIGTIKHIREGHITIYDNIDYIGGKTVHFVDGKKEDFDTIVAAIGFYRDYSEMIDVEQNRFDDLKLSLDKQKFFGKDGLYFCGFWIAPTGQIREIAMDAQKIAKDIFNKKNLTSSFHTS